MIKTKHTLWAAALTAGLNLFSTSDLLAQTCRGPQPTICNRSCWGARASSGCSSMSTLSRAIIHHTAGTGDYTTSNDYTKPRNVQNYHMDVNGWCDVGYHFLFNAGGYIYEGRVGSMNASSWYSGAHDGCNSSSMGFSCMGYYHPPYNQAFTSALENALEAAIAWRMPTGWSATGSGTYCGNSVGTLDGHYKVKATACPGDTIIAKIANIRTDVATERSCGVSKTPVTVDNPAASFVGASWATGTSATDKYGSDYRYHSTAPISEPATFTATLNTSASWNVRAWWPQGANRSATAPYVVEHNAGSTTVNKNQQANGGSWQLLGSWTMSGTKTVQLSCWTTTGYIVVADAVKWD